MPAEPIQLTPADVRRLTPIAMDLIRDQLAPPQFRANKLGEVVASGEDPWKLLAIFTYLGRSLSRSIAHAWSTENDGSRTFSAEDALQQIEREIVENWVDEPR